MSAPRMRAKEAEARQRKKEREEARMASDPEYAAMMEARKAEYVLDKSRLSIRLQPSYSEERRRKISENAKLNGFNSQTE